MMKESDISFGAHYFVVIDAVPEGELQTARHIYNNIRDYLQNTNQEMKCEHFKCNTPIEFLDILHSIKEKIINSGQIPFIHIEGHGEKSYLKMPNNAILRWEIIFEHFREINIYSKNNLFVSMGACESAHAYQASKINRECPVFGMLAPAVVVQAGDVMDSFIAFYKGLIEENSFKCAIDRFMETSPRRKFSLIFSQRLFKEAAYKYIKNYCMGSGKLLRQEQLLTELRANTILPLRTARRLIKKEIKNHMRNI